MRRFFIRQVAARFGGRFDRAQLAGHSFDLPLLLVDPSALVEQNCVEILDQTLHVHQQFFQFGNASIKLTGVVGR